VIIGATQLEQLEENCQASGVTLPASALTAIDAIFPGPR
jgi:aryl-alcohol dehydrogenase-like predicted oxidoreductase